MRASLVVVIALFSIVVVGCIITPSAIPNKISTNHPRQPEPQQPLIRGDISGVHQNTLITIHVCTTDGREASYITRQGNGIWEAVVTDVSGIDYLITAEAVGFISSPISYSIHLDDMTAFLNEHGLVTSTEASRLDFHFKPANTSTPNPHIVSP